MADETTATPAVEAQATPEATTTATPSAGTQKTETPAEVMIPKSRLDEVLGKLKAFEQDKTKAERDREAAETARLAEQGKYKEIADGLQAKLDAAQNAERAATLKLLQRDAATSTGLPQPLADRLKGETLDEMVADAKSILAALPKPAAPNINASNGAGGAPVAGQMSDREINEQAVRMGVNPKLLKQQYGMQ